MHQKKNHELPQKTTANTYSKGLGRLEWVFSCALNEYLLAKSFPQVLHTYGLTPKWVFMCSSNKFLLLYLLLQLLHSHALAWGKWILIKGLFKSCQYFHWKPTFCESETVSNCWKSGCKLRIENHLLRWRYARLRALSTCFFAGNPVRIYHKCKVFPGAPPLSGWLLL